MQEDSKFKKWIFNTKIKDKIQTNELLVQVNVVTTFNDESLSKWHIFSILKINWAKFYWPLVTFVCQFVFFRLWVHKCEFTNVRANAKEVRDRKRVERVRSQKEESYLVDESKENGNHDENTDKNLSVSSSFRVVSRRETIHGKRSQSLNMECQYLTSFLCAGFLSLS